MANAELKSDNKQAFLEKYNGVDETSAEWTIREAITYIQKFMTFLPNPNEAGYLFGLYNPEGRFDEHHNWIAKQYVHNQAPINCLQNGQSIINIGALKSFFAQEIYDRYIAPIDWKKEVRDGNCEIHIHETVPHNCPKDNLCQPGNRKHMTVQLVFLNLGDNDEGFNPVGDHDEDQEPNGDNNVEVLKIVESHESQISYYNYGDFKNSKYGGCNKNGCCNCSKQAGSGTCAVTDNYCLRGCKYMFITVHSSEKMC